MNNTPSDNAEQNNSSYNLNHEEKLIKYNLNQKKAMITIMLCIFIDVLGYSMIIPILPTIAQFTYGASNFMIGFIIASNALTAFIFAPIWGKLSDKYGRKPFLIISQLGTFAAFLMLGFSDSLTTVILSRILDGVFGGQIPIIRAYVTDVTDEKSRAAEMGKFTGAIAFGIIFGPAIGGLLGSINWRYPVLLAALLSIITIIFTLRFLKESMPKQRILDLKEKRKLKQEKHGKDKSLLFKKIVLLHLFELFLTIFAFIMINTSFPLVTYLRYGFDVFTIGLVASLFGVMMMISAGILMKPLIKKYGEKSMLIFSVMLSISMFLVYPFLYTSWSLFIFIFPYVFSHVFTRALLMTNLTKSVEEDKQGEVSGYATNMQAIGQITAPIVAYFYLEIWLISVLGFNLDAYFLIGFTCAIASFILLLLILYDMKKYPEVFIKAELELKKDKNKPSL
ncbi:MAG: MFS transporter [Candidatus Hermodarchaeota archaeon]